MLEIILSGKRATIMTTPSQMDTSAVLEEIATNLEQAEFPAARSIWILLAAKHLTRLGKKDSVLAEIAKAENYLHKARTGEWLSELRPTHYGGSRTNADGDKS